MEEAAKVIGGVTGELVFLLRSFLLGFLLRLGYEPLILLRKLFRHPKLLVDLQDIFFWTVGSFMMFGLLFRENNGTPRLFSIVGILFGMLLYQLGPAKLSKLLFCKLKAKKKKLKDQFQKKFKNKLQNRFQLKYKNELQTKLQNKLQKKCDNRRKMGKKRLKKTKKDSMIKEQDEHSRNKRGEDSGRKNGSPQKSQPQVDHIGIRDSDPSKRDDLDRRKQSGRAKRTESGTAKDSRGKDRRGRGEKRRTRSVQ